MRVILTEMNNVYQNDISGVVDVIIRKKKIIIRCDNGEEYCYDRTLYMGEVIEDDIR